MTIIAQLTLLMLCLQIHSDNEWHSGGGVFANNRDNPWLLNAQDPITYCINIDEEHFGTTQKQAQIAFEEAAKFWLTELTSPHQGLSKNTYDFSLPARHQCSEHTQLQLQLGVLEKHQKNHIPEPQNVVATTIRTSYDSEKLQGKGFIYISPETGPLAMNSTEHVEKPWSRLNSKALATVLKHELGHIYGLHHFQTTSSLEQLDLMHPSLPRAAIGINPQAKQKGLTAAGISDIIIQRTFHNLFKPSTSGVTHTCGNEARKFKKFFDWPQGHHCIGIHWDSKAVSIFAINMKTQTSQHIYTSKITKKIWNAFSETLLYVDPHVIAHPSYIDSKSHDEEPILQRYSTIIMLPHYALTFTPDGWIRFSGIQKNGFLDLEAIEIPFPTNKNIQNLGEEDTDLSEKEQNPF